VKVFDFFAIFYDKSKSKMKKFSKAFLKCIRETQISSVRVGKDRTRFTGIWMVEIGGRIFGCSYYGAERSWYTAFLDGNDGDIKCGKEVVPVKGVKLNPIIIEGIAAKIGPIIGISSNKPAKIARGNA